MLTLGGNMPRVNLIRKKNLPYHVTIKTRDEAFFKLPLILVWEMALISLKAAYEKHPIELTAFVLMHNHYHLILNTPDKNLDDFMYVFNRTLAQKIKQKSKCPTPVFKARYKWNLIRSIKYLSQCYRYVYQNPLRVNLVKNAEDYPYSTLFYLSKKERFVIPIHDKFGLKDRYNLLWINEPMRKSEVDKIKVKMRYYVEPLNKTIT